MDPLRVAEVYARSGAQQRYGSGYLVAPDLVLTARHVVAHALDGARCEVRLHGDFMQGRRAWGDYEVHWSDATLDLALLRRVPQTPPYAGGAAALERLARLQRGEPADCVAVGYPKVMRHDGRNDTQEVRGVVQTLAMAQSGQWQVAVTGATPKDELDWQGVSGAALFCTGRLVGVVKQTETCFKDSVLIAQPIEAAFADPAFRRALGWHPDAELETFDPRFDPRPWNELYRLVYLVDRQTPVNELQSVVGETLNTRDAPRALVCAVPGEPEHLHGDLIELFRKETMPALFQGRPGFDDIVDIDWPRTAESVPHGLMLLRNQLHSHLGIAGGSAADSAARIAAALNGGDRPRAFYCELRDSFFTPLQHDLLLAWLAEWGRMADAGLNDLVTMFVCLVFDAAPQPPPRWKFWAAPQVLLRDVAREYFGTADAMRDHRRLRLVRLRA